MGRRAFITDLQRVVVEIMIQPRLKLVLCNLT